MTPRKAALAIWSARRPSRRSRDFAYLVYAFFLIGLIVVLPVARAVWIAVSGQTAIALLSSPQAPSVAVLSIAVLWAAFALLGSRRGPMLLPPFLSYVFGTSSLSPWNIYRLKFLAYAALLTVVAGGASALVAGSLATASMISASTIVVFILSGMLAGLIAASFSLIGQAFPRAAGLIALVLLFLGVLSWTNPAAWPILPTGWWGLVYPLPSASTQWFGPFLAIAALAVIASLLSPVTANRLSYEMLSAQSTKWNLATVFMSTMEFAWAAEVYQQRPHLGRTVRAVWNQRHISVQFLVRDAIGSLRTPGRLISGLLLLAGSGWLLASTLNHAHWLVSPLSTLLMFFGLGPLTDGLRHALQVASDFPLYGVGDKRLVLYHAMYPFTVSAVTLGVSTGVTAAAFGTNVVVAVAFAFALSALSLAVRISHFLKGTMPLELLGPAPTPLGDANALLRVLWALDSLLISLLIGASLPALLGGQPIVAFFTVALIASLVITRWRRRR